MICPRRLALFGCLVGLPFAPAAAPPLPLFPTVGEALTPTLQTLRPAGEHAAFPGRPVDLVVSPDGKRLYIKDNRGLVVIDRATWKVVQELRFPGKTGGSMTGIAVTGDGKTLYLSTAHNHLHEASVGADGKVEWSRAIALPGPGGKGAAHAAGIALSPDEKTVYVCLSRNNSLGVVDRKAGKLVRQLPVSVAPYGVLVSSDGKFAYVSNWGGRHPKKGEKTAPSSGTPALIDERGVAKSGTVGKVDLAAGKQAIEVATGLHPAGLALHRASNRLFVANGNSDTVTVLDAGTMKELDSVSVRPDASLPFGSTCEALAVSADGRTLYVANGGNNAVAVVDLPAKGRPRVAGFVPAAWCPGAVALYGDELFVANIKGLGSRAGAPGNKGWSVFAFLGVVSKVKRPAPAQLARYTEQVRTDARVPQMLRAWEKGRSGKKAVPVPARLGEPSVFEHVVYVIKENRTYDQVFGDVKEGKGEPKLCIFGEKVTPNHHALARRFGLLDNFYCNGVVSADGHAWATEGHVTGYLERSFGGFTRSYTFGDDPLSYSATGFVWDHVLLHGLSFRNYGELDDAELVPAKATFKDVYDDYQKKTGKLRFTQKIGIEPLRRYTCPDYPGWNMKVPDVLRADAFLRELRGFEKKGTLPNFVVLVLPQDHTSGTSPGMPTPEAHVADNDLALGLVVEGLSRSRFWPKTCIFVIEDDPQNGFDHVDGHRSPCLVISPYAKGGTVRQPYNQTAVLHTMLRILGCPPMNQGVAAAPLMTACFTDKPDLKPYKALPANVPLDRLNAPKKALKGRALFWAEKSAALDWSGPDRADEEALNRILWFAARGSDEGYPAHLTGPHGRGLKALRLRHERSGK